MTPVLLNEIAVLRRERTVLVNRLARAGEARRAARTRRMIDRAFVDACTLLTLAIGGGDIARAVSPLTQRRWAHAVALLRLAGLARGRYTRLVIPAAHSATLERLQGAVRTAYKAPERWVQYMPAHARPTTLARTVPNSSNE